MGYADYLKQMLRPLGVYKLEQGYSAAEQEAVGAALDGVDFQLCTLLEGTAYDTASGEYLRKLEELFPIVRFKDDEAARRESVRTLLGVDDFCSELAALKAQLDACGVSAEIVESDSKFVAELHFTEIRGEPTDREKQVCRDIMPAHIGLKFVCQGVTWDRIEELYPTWDEFDTAGLTADEMMKLK